MQYIFKNFVQVQKYLSETSFSLNDKKQLPVFFFLIGSLYRNANIDIKILTQILVNWKKLTLAPHYMEMSQFIFVLKYLEKHPQQTYKFGKYAQKLLNQMPVLDAITISYRLIEHIQKIQINRQMKEKELQQKKAAQQQKKGILLKNLSYCPTPGCGYTFINQKQHKQHFRCQKCRKQYCFICQQKWEHGANRCFKYQNRGIEKTKRNQSGKMIYYFQHQQDTAKFEKQNKARGQKFKQCGNEKCKHWTEFSTPPNILFCIKCRVESCFKCGKKIKNCLCVIEKVNEQKKQQKKIEEQKRKGPKITTMKFYPEPYFNPIIESRLIPNQSPKVNHSYHQNRAYNHHDSYNRRQHEHMNQKNKSIPNTQPLAYNDYSNNPTLNRDAETNTSYTQFGDIKDRLIPNIQPIFINSTTNNFRQPIQFERLPGIFKMNQFAQFNQYMQSKRRINHYQAQLQNNQTNVNSNQQQISNEPQKQQNYNNSQTEIFSAVHQENSFDQLLNNENLGEGQNILVNNENLEEGQNILVNNENLREGQNILVNNENLREMQENRPNQEPILNFAQSAQTLIMVREQQQVERVQTENLCKSLQDLRFLEQKKKENQPKGIKLNQTKKKNPFINQKPLFQLSPKQIQRMEFLTRLYQKNKQMDKPNESIKLNLNENKNPFIKQKEKPIQAQKPSKPIQNGKLLTGPSLEKKQLGNPNKGIKLNSAENKKPLIKQQKKPVQVQKPSKSIQKNEMDLPLSCCPTIGCGQTFKSQNQRYKCQKCKKQYCLICKRKWYHQLSSCRQSKLREFQQRKSDWAHLNVKLNKEKIEYNQLCDQYKKRSETNGHHLIACPGGCNKLYEKSNLSHLLKCLSCGQQFCIQCGKMSVFCKCVIKRVNSPHICASTTWIQCFQYFQYSFQSQLSNFKQRQERANKIQEKNLNNNATALKNSQKVYHVSEIKKPQNSVNVVEIKKPQKSVNATKIKKLQNSVKNEQNNVKSSQQQGKLY